jgi:hypothetical protein
MDEFDHMGGGGGRVIDGTGLAKWLVVPVRQKVMVCVSWFSKRCSFTTVYGAGNHQSGMYTYTCILFVRICYSIKYNFLRFTRIWPMFIDIRNNGNIHIYKRKKRLNLCWL